MRTIRISSNASSATWTVDKDCTLFGAIPVSSVAARMLVTQDPAATVADIESPSATFSAETFALYLRSSTSTNALGTILENLKIPLSVGNVIYVNFSTVGSVILLIEDVST